MPNTGIRAVMNRFGGFVLAGAAAITAVRPLPAQAPNPIAWEAFPLRTFDGQSHDVELGRLRVPESRARPKGSGVSVAFLRLKSSNPSPRAPIVFLMGGPGIPAGVMAPIPPYWTLFDALRADADVILLDQRGLGLSSPKLDCPPPAPPLDPAFLTSRAVFVKAYGAVIASCAMTFRAQGVDPRAYTDASIADDIEEIRSALAVPRVSLLGFSYGTRLALTFARRHPDRVDRLVLQGSGGEETTYESALGFYALIPPVSGAHSAPPRCAAGDRRVLARSGGAHSRLDSAHGAHADRRGHPDDRRSHAQCANRPGRSRRYRQWTTERSPNARVHCDARGRRRLGAPFICRA